MTRYRIFITSVGSLLGQNLLDSLAVRRDSVHVIGSDAGIIHPRIFQCDSLYLVPPVEAEEEFRARLLEIISAEKPDLVLPARDPDILTLCDLVAAEPRLATMIPVGSRAAAEMMNDKMLSHRFAQRHRLPFADSLLVDETTTPETVARFVKRHGLPLIAKPHCGSGSVGVRLLISPEHLARIDLLHGHVLQPHLGDIPSGLNLRSDEGAGVPLFTPPPSLEQMACQSVIAPDGSLASLFCFKVTMIAGRVEGLRLLADPELTRIGTAYSEAIAKEGWRGSFNVQLRAGRDGGYQAFEMNGRMTGSTSARLRLGGDDLGELVRAWHGSDRFPSLTVKSPAPACVVRRPADEMMLDADVAVLQSQKIWRASS